ncbi:MAG: hypothetical protein KDD45_03755 [Bdellovibrionales bacterium]|nr:hypothetical protein [Bdellovibrionales bacterium]
MKKNKRIILHGLFFLFLTFILCSFQSVVWFQLFGHFTAPFFTFVLFVYFGLDKDSWRSLIYCYSIVFLYSQFSFASLGILYFSSMITYIFLFFVKTRIYWPGSAYFAMMSSASLFLFNLTYVFSSLAFESDPTPVIFIKRLTELLLTTIFSYFAYSYIKRIDSLFKLDSHSEIRGEIHG